MGNTLHENLQNLAALARAGEYETPDALRNQIMRLWKGADFDAPTTTPAPSGTRDTSSTSPAGNIPSEAAGKCPNPKRHGTLKRSKESCACGYNNPPAEVPS